MEIFVKEVDGKPISTWQEFAEIIQDSPGVLLQFEVDRDGDSVKWMLSRRHSKIKEKNTARLA